jgi:hypothetical protein
MVSFLRQFVRMFTACFLTALFAFPPNAGAQAHLVRPSDLQKAAVAATQIRQSNLENVTQFLSSPEAEKAMRSAHIDVARVKVAVSTLSDEELAQVSARVDKAKADLAAGNLTDRDLLIILLAIVALVLIIVAVR